MTRVNEKKFWEKIESKLEIIAKFVAISVGISYALGFVIWNIYLQTLGFYPDLIQGRYVLAGIIYIFLIAAILGGIVAMKELYKSILPLRFANFVIFKLSAENSEASRFSLFVTLFLVFIYIYSIAFFPLIPGYIGGAKPKLISIIADEQNIEYLKNFGIGSASAFQTGLLCSVYDGNDNIIVVLEDRILSLKKENFRGFGSLPSVDSEKYIRGCNTTITSNLMGWRKIIIEKQNTSQ